jgi:ribose 1,5-bisphosphokinase
MRVALYYAPPADSAAWRRGSDWLGRDALNGASTLSVLEQSGGARARQAARYGWHATLKAPFMLQPALTVAQLIEHVAALARRFEPFDLPLAVADMAGFLVLRPVDPPPVLAELASACVVGLEPLADRRLPGKPRHGLNARQRQLLLRWGYPYVFEQYRFHLTLSDTLGPGCDATPLKQAAQRHFAGHMTPSVQGIALFAEAEADGPFRYLAHCGFDGRVANYAG